MTEPREIHWNIVQADDSNPDSVGWVTEIDGVAYQVTRGLVDSNLFYPSVYDGGTVKMLGEDGCKTLSDAIVRCGRDAFAGQADQQIAMTWDLDPGVAEHRFEDRTQALGFIDEAVTAVGASWVLSWSRATGCLLYTSPSPRDS